MGKLPIVSGQKVVNTLIKGGFEQVRQKGSHVALHKITENRTFKTIVPLHKELAKGTLMDILHQTGLTKDQLIELLKD